MSSPPPSTPRQRPASNPSAKRSGPCGGRCSSGELGSQPAAWALLATLAQALPPTPLAWQGSLTEPWRVFTAAFVHWTPWHLTMNLAGCAALAVLAGARPLGRAMRWRCGSHCPSPSSGCCSSPIWSAMAGSRACCMRPPASPRARCWRAGGARALGGRGHRPGPGRQAGAGAALGPALQTVQRGSTSRLRLWAHLCGTGLACWPGLAAESGAMGREANCHACVGAERADAKVLLEATELILRGAIKRRWPLSALEAVWGGRRCPVLPAGPESVSLQLGAPRPANGPTASPRRQSLAAKLGLAPEAPNLGARDGRRPLADALAGHTAPSPATATQWLAVLHEPTGCPRCWANWRCGAGTWAVYPGAAPWTPPCAPRLAPLAGATPRLVLSVSG